MECRDKPNASGSMHMYTCILALNTGVDRRIAGAGSGNGRGILPISVEDYINLIYVRKCSVQRTIGNNDSLVWNGRR